MKSTAFFVPLLAAAYASAHGILLNVGINGKNFKGNFPGASKSASIIRQVSTQDPIKGAKNPAVNCGKDATRASLSADANPGDTLTFDWREADGNPWPHNTGPMLTYMASCGDTPCEQFDTTKAKWFKIQQVGRKSNGKWAQEDLMNGSRATATLPDNIAPGNYMIRHEIIALHLANQRGGAEFYPGCAQLKIGGNGNGVPKDSDLVSLPGAYSDDDKGIFVPNVFDNNAPYDFPGPEIASFVDGGNSNSGNTDGGDDSDSGSDGGSSGTSTYGSSRPKPTSSKGNGGSSASSSSSSSTKCKVKKNSNKARDLSARHSPRQISRIMRSLAHGHSH